MKLRLNEKQLAQLNAYLDAGEDCERLSAREAVLDLYDIEKPVSLNIVFVKGGIAIDGAAYLLFSDADDGYYMGDRIMDADIVRETLIEAGVFSAS